MKLMAVSQSASKEKAYFSQMKSRISLCNWSRWLERVELQRHCVVHNGQAAEGRLCGLPYSPRLPISHGAN